MRRKILPPHQVRLPPGARRAEAVREHLRDGLEFDRDTTEVLACGGAGRLPWLLAPYVRRLTVVDAAPTVIAEFHRALAASPRGNMRALCLEWDSAARRLPPAAFDLVILDMVCHHLPGVENFLGEIKSLLKPDGILCIIDLQKEDGGFHSGDTTVPHAGFSPEEWQHWLEASGFFGITVQTPYTMTREAVGDDGSRHRRDYPLALVLADNAPPARGAT